MAPRGAFRFGRRPNMNVLREIFLALTSSASIYLSIDRAVLILDDGDGENRLRVDGVLREYWSSTSVGSADRRGRDASGPSGPPGLRSSDVKLG